MISASSAISPELTSRPPISCTGCIWLLRPSKLDSRVTNWNTHYEVHGVPKGVVSERIECQSVDQGGQDEGENHLDSALDRSEDCSPTNITNITGMYKHETWFAVPSGLTED